MPKNAARPPGRKCPAQGREPALPAALFHRKGLRHRSAEAPESQPGYLIVVLFRVPVLHEPDEESDSPGHGFGLPVHEVGAAVQDPDAHLFLHLLHPFGHSRAPPWGVWLSPPMESESPIENAPFFDLACCCYIHCIGRTKNNKIVCQNLIIPFLHCQISTPSRYIYM